MEYVRSVIVHPGTIWGFVAILIIWALCSGVQAKRATMRLTRSLNQARIRLSQETDALQFAAHFESVSSDLLAFPYVGPRWRQYRETLVIPGTPHGPIHATTHAEQWFDLSLCADAGLGQRYHSILPNLLVGSGLLFTFLGLTVALNIAGDVVADGIQQAARNAALHELLNAASFKFVTSLFGLLLSIAYTLFWRQICLKGIDGALGRFLTELEIRVPLLTPTAAQSEMTEVARRQLDQLEMFNTDLAVSIATAVDTKLDQRLGDHIGPLTRAMEQLAQGMSTQNQDAIGTMLNAFLEKLRGGAGDKMQEVAERLATLGESLQDLRTGLQDAATRMAESSELMARRMGEGAEEALSRITNQMDGLLKSLRQVAEQTRTAGADAVQDMVTRIEQAAGGFEAAARTVAAALAQAMNDLQGRLTQEAESGSARLSAQFEQMIAELRSLAEASRRTGDQAFAELAERIGAAASGFEASADRVAHALVESAKSTGATFDEGARDAVQRIAAATEGMRTELQTMLAEFGTTLGGAGETLRRGGAAGAEAFTDSLGGAGQDLAQSVAAAASVLRDAGDATSAALQRGGENAGARIDQAAGDIATRVTALSHEVAALARTAKELPNRIGELERVLGAATPSLAITAADMRAAGEAARGSVQPLREVGQSVTAAVEQINGAAQRLQGAEASAQTLAQGLTTAAQRFEGLDGALATIADKLAVRVQEFTRQTTEFTVQTDQNLATAVNHLGKFVTALEDALEDQRLPPPRAAGPR